MSGAYDFVNKGTKRAACERGASFSREIVWKDGSGTAIDLTGYTPTFEIRADKSGPVMFSNTPTKVNNQGKLTISLTSTETASLSVGVYYYSIILDGGPTSTVRLIEGAFEVA